MLVVILVVGSRHDSVAVSLAATWPNAGLVSAEDLTAPGWSWTDRDGAQQWVIAGRLCDDRLIRGVFVRRSTVLPEELVHIHPDDRAYLAAETQAFLVAMLGATSAKVVNPVGDGALGDELVRPERWMVAATTLGLSVRPLHLTSSQSREHESVLYKVEVVASRGIGDVPQHWRNSAVELVASLGLVWAVCVFDSQGRLVALTPSAAPTIEASLALSELLERKAP